MHQHTWIGLPEPELICSIVRCKNRASGSCEGGKADLALANIEDRVNIFQKHVTKNPRVYP